MLPDEFSAEKRRRVLVIDDSELDRRLLRVRLSTEDLELLESNDGQSGLEVCREHRPDLVLLDLFLPGWDGFETIRYLKADPRTSTIPVIFLSAASSTAEKARGLELGAVDFVTKPFEPIELIARVRAALRTKYLQDLLEQRAHLDGLTGLGNRLALEERLTVEWANCRRRGCPLTILIADLDHFKAINDEQGHYAGDHVLRLAAQTLRASVRAGDFVARFGGEEFVVVAADCDLPGGIMMAERFRAGIASQIMVLKRSPLRVTSSVGVAEVFAPLATGPLDVLERADRALYRAKAAGRNAVWAWHQGQVVPTLAGHLAGAAVTPTVAATHQWKQVVGL